MAIEGELVVRIDWDGTRVIGADIRSTRPQVVGRLLAGRPTGDAAAMLPRLYSICGNAQAAAAHAAIDAAAGKVMSSTTLRAHEVAVLLETVQEYLWRLLIDWPQVLGRAPLIAVVAPVRHRLVAAIGQLNRGERTAAAISDELVAVLAALLTEHVLGETPARFLARADAAAFDGWLAETTTLPASLAAELVATAPGLGRSSTALMPAAGRAELLSAVVPGMRDNAEFALAPVWGGMTVETGALARVCDQPMIASLLQREGRAVVTRITARLVELALLVDALRNVAAAEAPGDGSVLALPLAAGEGLAAVQTARGLLLHRARVADNRVVDYQIVAPTEWNFHPAGPLVQGLEGAEVAAEATLSRQARLAVQALDPCVACRIEVIRA